MVNVAIIGAGFMGKTHLTAYKAMNNANVTAVCDLNETQGRALAEEAVQTSRPRHIVSRMLRRVAAGVLIALCALLFWLIGVLIYPVG